MGSDRLSYSGRFGASAAGISSFARSLTVGRPHWVSRRVTIAFICDEIVCFACLILAISAAERYIQPLMILKGHWKAFIAWMVLVPIAMYYFDGYSAARFANRMNMVMSAIKASIAAAIGFGTAIFFLSSDSISRQASFNIICYTAFGLILWRILFSATVRNLLPQRNVLIIGAGRAGSAIAETLGYKEDYNLLGFVDDDTGKLACVEGSLPILGAVAEAPEIAGAGRVDMCVMAITGNAGAEVHRSLQRLYRMGIPIVPMADLYEFSTGRVALDHWGERWYVNIAYSLADPLLLAIKRMVDFCVALLAVVVGFPLWLLVSLAIKTTSKGPVLYRQDRVGLNGRIFTIWKFRSMLQNAEAKSGAVWASKDDPRITLVGRVLRKSRIDELPQLLNVLRGDMSLVGPRPERPEFVHRFEAEIPFYGMRVAMRPGLTGWAQVLHKYDESLEDVQRKLQYDLFYIKHWSPFLDLRILIRTVAIVLTGQGAN